MFRKLTIISILLLAALCMKAQSSIEELMPVRGFSIAAPGPEAVDHFVTFIEEELAIRDINVRIKMIKF